MISMSDYKTMEAPNSVWHRGAGEAAALYTTGQGATLSYNASFAANTVDEPYTVAPGSQFRLFRSRVLGGRTNHYARVQLRYSDYDFKPKSMRGVGWDWPIGYQDLAPYYDKAERLIGVTGKPGRAAQRARRDLPDAGALQDARGAGRSRLHQAGHQGDQLAPGGHHQPVERTPGLHLLRAVRPRLQVRLELRVDLRADLPGDADRPRDRAEQRDGARARHRRVRQGHRGLVHRQDDAAPSARCGAARSSVGGRLRVGAAAAQLEVGAPSQRDGQRERAGRQVPHRHRRPRRVGDGAVSARHADSQHRRLRRPPLHSLVDGRSPQRARLPVRLSRRSGRRRLRDAEPRLRRRGLQPERRLRPADEAGDPRDLRRHDRQPDRPRLDGAERGLATARSIPTPRTSGAFRCCASIGSGATTS